MPEVQVAVYATLREHVGGKTSVTVEIEPGETVRQVLKRLDVPLGEVKLIFINARAATLDTPLDDAKTLAVFPLIAGG
jgi:molybdopterin converting factor small subunit